MAELTASVSMTPERVRLTMVCKTLVNGKQVNDHTMDIGSISYETFQEILKLIEKNGIPSVR